MKAGITGALLGSGQRPVPGTRSRASPGISGHFPGISGHFDVKDLVNEF
jgi:hypothetical protein